MGDDLFLERLSQAFVFETQVVAGRLQGLMAVLGRINRGNWMGQLIVALQGHYPIYLTVRKGAATPASLRMKTISIVTGCFNEDANVEELYTRVRKVMAEVGRYRYEHIFIDNSSTDRTVDILKRIASTDTNVRVIVNARNFGHIRSPIHAAYQASGDASSEWWPTSRIRRK